jgi:hypothetical protein
MVTTPVPTQPVLAGQYHEAEAGRIPEGNRVLLSCPARTTSILRIERRDGILSQDSSTVHPADPAAASADEMEILRHMSFLNGTHLGELSSSISSHHIETDVNTLFHLHASS